MESSICPMSFSIVWMFFMNTIKMMASAMTIVHVWFEIWIISMVFWVMMHWIRMEFSLIEMMGVIPWVTRFPIMVSMMIAKISVLVTWKVFFVVVSWLTSHWCHMNWVVDFSMVVMVLVWLHLQHEVSFLNVSLGCTERCAVGIESGIVTLMPPVGVKCIEIVFPVEIEATSLMVIFIGLDIVIKQVPWHVFSIKTFAPRLKHRGPEVHHNRL